MFKIGDTVSISNIEEYPELKFYFDKPAVVSEIDLENQLCKIYWNQTFAWIEVHHLIHSKLKVLSNEELTKMLYDTNHSMLEIIKNIRKVENDINLLHECCRTLTTIVKKMNNL